MRKGEKYRRTKKKTPFYLSIIDWSCLTYTRKYIIIVLYRMQIQYRVINRHYNRIASKNKIYDAYVE